MSTIIRKVYVISDLHLGGRFGDGAGDRGFRMMDRPDALASFIEVLAEKQTAPAVELVINGDFVDFLAEEVSKDKWKPFRDEPGEAVDAFSRLASRKEDGEVFDALARFLDAGHRLTVLIGNHDIELTWPEVRAAFERRLRESHKKTNRAFDLRWLLDGEALIVGDALIEHGNRYDPANFVDHERLRHLRELRSRRLYGRERGIFHPPVGSRLVAEVMNPVKKDYPFIDLLKPESEPLFALLLALDPSQRKRLGALAGVLSKIPLMPADTASDPGYRQRISGGDADRGISRSDIGSTASSADDRALSALLSRIAPPEQAVELQEGLARISDDVWEVSRNEIASLADRAAAVLSLFRLVGQNTDGEMKKRLPLLRGAVRALRGDQTFDDGVETGARYLRAARELAAKKEEKARARAAGSAPVGFRFVIFGHTHHRKKLDLAEQGATYVNTGTWARLMKFPHRLLCNDDAVAVSALVDFVQSIKDGTYETDFVPSFARVDLRDDRHADAVELETYDPASRKVG
ncbi:MAG: metallophosphoesterase [Polyangiaceae bacterium]|nr:metallophosphoesterase [Polyangiaceae bacterium]